MTTLPSYNDNFTLSLHFTQSDLIMVNLTTWYEVCNHITIYYIYHQLPKVWHYLLYLPKNDGNYLYWPVKVTVIKFKQIYQYVLYLSLIISLLAFTITDILSPSNTKSPPTSCRNNLEPKDIFLEPLWHEWAG
jgi:hypothetical protein